MEITSEVELLLDQSDGAIGLVEVIEIYHPDWGALYPRNDLFPSEILIPKLDGYYRFVANSNQSITVKHEDGKSCEYDYLPMTIQRASDSETLEQEVTVFFGDVGTEIPQLINIILGAEDIVLPIVNYRAYVMGRYDAPLWVARDLEIESVSRNWEGTRFDAKAPSLNESGNGEVYNATDDPSMVGFY